MNNSFTLQKISRTGNLDSNLVSRQNKLNQMADFMLINYEIPRTKQSEIANQLSYSTSTLQRYKNDINMPAPYRIHPNNTNKRTKKPSNTNFDINSHREHDLKRPRSTSIDLKRPKTISDSSTEVKPVKSENKLEGGGNFESNDEYLDENLQNNNS